MPYKVNQYHNSSNRRNTSTEQKAVEGFLKGLWWLISLPFRLIFGRKGSYQPSAKTSLDREFVSSKWAEIEELMRLGSPSNYSRAVLEADKLLDHVLKSFRSPGLTMGDRLKASQKRFSSEGYNAAWQAHKVRNELVHNAQFQLMDYNAKQAIDQYKQAIDELL